MSYDKLLLVFLITLVHYSSCVPINNDELDDDVLNCVDSRASNIQEQGYKTEDQDKLADFLLSTYCYRFKKGDWTVDPQAVTYIFNIYKPKLTRDYNCTNFNDCEIPIFPADNLKTNDDKLKKFIRVVLGIPYQ
ncbi:uncharacterized protein LOC130671575 [Microplitis mediator]|uniref:uncharacterized protein LOC130671575 n=1 Tax=Microplitis mediator TaxID=375433 RepID=UPI0025543881|nr:uncharacterized protein LOC130671575 [Microplitis mediator]